MTLIVMAIKSVIFLLGLAVVGLIGVYGLFYLVVRGTGDKKSHG